MKRNLLFFLCGAAAGAALASTDPIPSGAILACGEDRATVTVPGDVSGDAKINARDVFCAMSELVGAKGEFFTDAIDVDANGEANGRDVVKTDAAGRFTLPAWERARFLSVTTPSGWRASALYSTTRRSA